MKNLKAQLILLGEDYPELRPHIRTILGAKYDNQRTFMRFGPVSGHNITKNYPKFLQKWFIETNPDAEFDPNAYKAWEKKMMTSDFTPYFTKEIWTHLEPKGVVNDRNWYRCSVSEYGHRVRKMIGERKRMGVDIESATEIFVEG